MNVSKSQSGKSWRVKIGSEFYGANFDSKIDGAVGRQIDFEWDDGKFGKWVKTWAYVGESGKQVNPPETPITREPVQQVKIVDRWWANFVSNVVAHAIAAGVIKEPIQLDTWAKAAKHAICNAEDDIDF